jgi:hypothetical protein
MPFTSFDLIMLLLGALILVQVGLRLRYMSSRQAR